MEDWVTIRNLKSKNPELCTRAIARLLGISRNTVKKALASENGPDYSREGKVNPDLLPFESYIKDLLWRKRFRGSRILNEIKSKGYKGSKSAFYRFLKKIKVPDNRHFTSNKLIASHKLSLEKGKVIINKEHYRGNKNNTGNWERLKEIFLERYPGSEQFLLKLQAQKRINARYHLGRMLQIGDYYHPDQVKKVIELSLEYNVFNYSFFLGYLEKHYKHTIRIPKKSDNPYLHSTEVNVIRNLDVYRLGGHHEQ